MQEFEQKYALTDKVVSRFSEIDDPSIDVCKYKDTIVNQSKSKLYKLSLFALHSLDIKNIIAWKGWVCYCTRRS